MAIPIAPGDARHGAAPVFVDRGRPAGQIAPRQARGTCHNWPPGEALLPRHPLVRTVHLTAACPAPGSAQAGVSGHHAGGVGDGTG